MDMKKLFEIQNKLNGYEHITNKYFPKLGDHLWNKFTKTYNYNILNFYNSLDSNNKVLFDIMIKECFDVYIPLKTEQCFMCDLCGEKDYYHSSLKSLKFDKIIDIFNYCINFKNKNFKEEIEPILSKYIEDCALIIYFENEGKTHFCDFCNNYTTVTKV